MNKKFNGELFNVLKLLRKRLFLLLFMVVLGGSLSFLYSKFLVSPIYSVKATYLLRSNQSVLPDSVSATNAELSSVTLFQKQMQTYLELGQQTDVYKATSQEMQLSTEERKKISTVKVTNKTDSQLITITVTGKDFSLIKKYAATFGQKFKEFASEKFGSDNLQMVNDAEGKKTPISPSYFKNTLIGALVFLFWTIAIIVVQYIRKDLIETDEEIEEILGVPIIGAIPRTSNSDIRKAKKTSQKSKPTSSSGSNRRSRRTEG